MLCSLMHIMQTCYPVTDNEPLVFVDWLPRNHILGGTCSFGMALANGAALYIDDGKPVPGQIEETVRNLREIAPIFYMSVPKGYEELLPWLQRDRLLCETFFSRVRILQYCGASLSGHVCDTFDELALATVGRRIPWVALLGSTEGGLIAMCQTRDAVRAGGVGLPGPGITLKLAPMDGKLEARVKGPCVMPGYWQSEDLTAKVFDEDGFLRTGDALDWIDPQDRQKGLRYDGRLAENFKLASGTWVRVGPLRAQLLKSLGPDVRDVVIVGENRDYIAVLALPSAPGIAGDKAAQARIRTKLATLARDATGSAQRVLRLAFLTGKLSIDAGELTDKGALNQRTILRHRSAEVDDLYAEVPPEHVISVHQA
jgi:feruloyl-CoA synthase